MYSRLIASYMRFMCVLVCVILASLANPALADDVLVPKLTLGGGGAQLAFYHSSCGEESSHECVVVDVGCSQPGQFKVTIYGLSAKEVGQLFSKHEGKASIVAGGSSRDALVRKIEYTDMDQDWTADFDDFPQVSRLWNTVASTGIASIAIGTHIRRLPTSPAAMKSFARIARICSKAK